MTPKQYQRKKISQICSFEAYQRLKKWIIEYRERSHPKAAKTGYFTIEPEKFQGFYKNTSHREYLSKFLENMIVFMLENSGYIAKKVETKGTKIKAKSGKEIYIQSGIKINKGEPDVYSLINGVATYFEVKVKADRLSDAQADYIEKLERNGAKVYIIKTVDEFLQIFEQL